MIAPLHSSGNRIDFSARSMHAWTSPFLIVLLLYLASVARPSDPILNDVLIVPSSAPLWSSAFWKHTPNIVLWLIIRFAISFASVQPSSMITLSGGGATSTSLTLVPSPSPSPCPWPWPWPGCWPVDVSRSPCLAIPWPLGSPCVEPGSSVSSTLPVPPLPRFLVHLPRLFGVLIIW